MRCKKVPGVVTCLNCHKQFETRVGGKRERVVCSREYANAYFHTYKNPSFTRTDRSERYSTICWQHHVKRCIICGEERVVEAHHHNEKHDDNRPENFVPLCPTHHQYWHSRHRHLILDEVERYVTHFCNCNNLPVIQQIECYVPNVEVVGATPTGKA